MTKADNSNGTVQRRGGAFDPDAPVAREKLPDELQKLVDDEESLMDQIYDGTWVFGTYEEWCA